MISLKQTVIVEGKYDKIKVEKYIDANIIATNGFSIFHDKQKIQLIRRIAEKDGIIILTDSDSAGCLIRSHLCGFIKPEFITNVFIPKIKGKERRKNSPSAEGTLGVEGISGEIILEALEKAGVTVKEHTGNKVTVADLFLLGLNGTPDSKIRRERVMQRLGLPEGMSTSQFLTAINALYNIEEFKKEVKEIF